MHTVLYCSPSGVVYETRAYTKADIDKLVQTQGLHCLSSADRQFDFWFSASPRKCQRQTNTIATELLMATTNFSARTVPLLRGCVVIATHDSDGDLDGLSWQQLDPLKETKADLEAIRGNLKSRHEVIAERGRDPADVDAEIQSDPLPAKTLKGAA